MQQDIDMEQARKLAADMGVTVEQLLGPQDDNLPKAVPVRLYAVGQPLVTRDESVELPTNMRNLHNWYMNEIMLIPERKWILLDVAHEYYYKEDKIHIEFSELYQLFHFDAIDKTLMSCYCL